MRHRTHLVSAMLAVVLPAAVPAQGPAAELLPADTGFVAHVDFRQISQLFDVRDMLESALADEGEDGEQVLAVLRRLERRYGFDPLRDLHSVTVFDRDIPDDTPQVLLIAGGGTGDLIAGMRDEGALERERRGGLRFDRLRPSGVAGLLGVPDVDGHDDDAPLLYIEELGRGRHAILIGSGADELMDAALVLDGEEPSMADRRGHDLQLRSSPGSMAYVEVGVPLEEWADDGAGSQIAQKVQGFAAEVGEDGDELHLRLAVRTESAADARAVAAVVNGLRGLVQLAGESEDIPEFARDTIADAVAEADGDRVTVALKVPTADVMEMLTEEMGGWDRFRRRHRHHDDDDDDYRRNRWGKKRRVVR